jgi:tetratricopeptide (TPR) repeat protein
MKVLFYNKLLMNIRVLFLCGLVCSFGVTCFAADPMEQARTLADTGDFQKASEVAAALGDSEGLAFAAASLAVFAYEIAEESDSQKLFLMAIRYAEMAVELDPTSSEAYLQLAHTLGRYAQTLGTLTALSEGYAEQIRSAIDTAIELDPKNYRAYLSLGAWHSEIIHAGFMAWLIYGGDEDESLEAYSMALGIAPEDNNVHFQYAVGLLKLDDSNLEQALRHLTTAAELPVSDAYGEIVREKAKQMLEKFKKE